jgi:outer membrane receptor protein involved in Fe transport
MSITGMSKTYLRAACTALLAAIATQARSQAIDYGALEKLFGEPVTTSATGVPQRVSEVPANMTIITADEIRQSGSRNIPEILSRVPGLDILRDSISSFDVGIRGYQQPFQPRLLVLVDGRQVFIDDYSRTIWDNIPVNIDDIRQIEVVKGASSALFGSNAAGGVINIVTYSPLYDHNEVAAASFGTQKSLTGDATVTEHGSWGGTKFSAGGMTSDEFDTPRQPFDQIPTFQPRKRYVANTSVFTLTPDLLANTEATYAKSTANTIDGISYLTAAQETMTYSARAGLNWQSPYGLITNDNYFNHSFVNFFEIPDGGAPYGLTVNMFVSHLQDLFKIGANNTFRAAVEYRHKKFTSTSAAVVPQDSELVEDNYAASGMWLWRINENLSWTNAVRFDQQNMKQVGTLAPGVVRTIADYNHRNDVWSGNSDVVYRATDLDTFRLGFGRGVQLPSMIQSGFNAIFVFDGVPEDSEGNPTLKPTIVQDFALDYSRKLTPIASMLKLSTFYEFNQDVAALDFGGFQTILGQSYAVFNSDNLGNSHGWGGEIELKGSHPAGYRWDASYSYTQVVDSPGVARTIDYQGSAPQHQVRLLLGYTSGAWEFDVDGQYVTSTKMIRSTDGGLTAFPTRTNGYASLGGRIGYNVNDHIAVALSGANITRSMTQESPYPAVERQIILTLTGKL